MLRQWLTEPLALRRPWGSWLGLARTLMALGTAGTLTFSGTDVLFSPVVGVPLAPACEGVGALSVFCVLPREQLSLLKWLCVAVLLVVASGWRPRWTALPHWWIASSVFTSVAITDGGDQAAAVLTLLLLPVLLTDDRRWHWQRSTRPLGAPRAPRRWAVGAAVVALLAVKVQVAVLYFQASVAKLGQPEWVDGTGMYYWMSDDIFGPADWLRPLTEAVVDNQALLLTMTWMPLVIEFSLALSLLLPPWTRWPLLVLGTGLHLSIAVIMGLWSFSLVMIGACILLLTPLGGDLHGIRHAVGSLRERRRRGQPTPMAARLDRTGAA